MTQSAGQDTSFSSAAQYESPHLLVGADVTGVCVGWGVYEKKKYSQKRSEVVQAQYRIYDLTGSGVGKGEGRGVGRGVGGGVP